MKSHLLRIIALFWVPSAVQFCTVIKHPTAGIYASVGGNTRDLQSDADGFSFDRNNNSKGMGLAGDAVQDVVRLQGLLNIGEAAIGEVGDGVQSGIRAVEAAQ